jgi:Zn-dependent protease
MDKIVISDKLILFIEFLPVFFFSLSIHEFSHAYAAYKKGDPTAKALGRLTLNPIKHIDLVGTLLMPFLSYFTGAFFIGWAKPVPVNRGNLRNPRKDDIIVSIAGPASNLLLAFILSLFLALIVKLPAGNEKIIQLLWMGVTFNVFLFFFNLLPIPPLDGSHVIANIFPNSAYVSMLSHPLVGTMILFVFIFSPLWRYFIYFIQAVLKYIAALIV